MPVETAADIAGFFADGEYAEAADYLAPGGIDTVPCLVILDRGQGRSRFASAEQQTAGTDRHLWAMAGDGDNQLPDVKRNGTFTITADGEVLTVADLPRLDEAGHLWSVALLAAA